MRLARFGYRTRTLASRTYEEAPMRWCEWLPQRRRWLKGWLQTALVALRRGGGARLRPIDALAVHGLISGAVLSLLVYPLSIALLVVLATLLLNGWQPASTGGWAFLAVNAANLTGFLLGSTIACLRGLKAIGALRLALLLPTLPLYWLLMSVAAWQAVFQLLRDPFGWEKTAHGVSQNRPSLAPSAAHRRAAANAG